MVSSSHNLPYEKIGKNEPVCIADEIPFEIPESWEWVRLGSLVLYQNGYAYSKSDYSKKDKGTPVIKSNNLMTLHVKINHKTNYIENPTEKMLESRIHDNDLLMCLSSQSENTEPLGKTAIFKLGIPALLNQRVLKMTPIDVSIVKWLYYVINSEYFHYTVSHRSGGSAQSNLKLEHVLTMLIPISPIQEQICIVDRLKDIFKYIEKYELIEEKRFELNNTFPEKLKKSILQQAVMGKLVPQYENDEPASILLEKIRSEKETLIKDGKLKKDKHESFIYRRDNSKL